MVSGFGLCVFFQNFRRYPLQNREGLLVLPLELGIFQLLQHALVSRLVQGLNRPILCGQYKKEACKG